MGAEWNLLLIDNADEKKEDEKVILSSSVENCLGKCDEGYGIEWGSPKLYAHRMRER